MRNKSANRKSVLAGCTAHDTGVLFPPFATMQKQLTVASSPRHVGRGVGVGGAVIIASATHARWGVIY